MPWTEERREKIVASKRGKKRPRHVIEAMRQGRLGKPLSEEAREKMSQAHKARGTLVPGTEIWTEEEDDAVRKLTPKEAAQETGRSLNAVWQRRQALGLPDGRRGRLVGKPLTIEQVLAWADAHRQRKGKWPNTRSGSVPEAPDETWLKIDESLRMGHRGLPGGKSLRQLLRDRSE